MAGCNPAGVWPTDADFAADAAEALRSVVGPWYGYSDRLTLSMQITQGPGGQLIGSGTLRDRGDSTAAAFTLSATFARPNFVLMLHPMRWKGHQVRGTFRSQYTSAAGMTDELVLEGTDGDPFVERIALSLQESY